MKPLTVSHLFNVVIIAVVLALYAGTACAWSLDDLTNSARNAYRAVVGKPSVDDVSVSWRLGPLQVYRPEPRPGFQYLPESSQDINFSITNGSKYYVSDIDITCDAFDRAGNRLITGRNFSVFFCRGWRSIAPGNRLEISCVLDSGILTEEAASAKCRVNDVVGSD